MNTRAVGYVRVSRVAGREGDSFLSPELQRESIARVCQREGLELVEYLLSAAPELRIAIVDNKARFFSVPEPRQRTLDRLPYDLYSAELSTVRANGQAPPS